MNINVYSMFDSAAQAFTQPFFLQNDGLAIRAFQDNVNSKEPNNVSEHPDQFTLFRIASYDDKTGTITPEEKPRSLGIGVTFKQEQVITTNEATAFIEQLKKIEATIQTMNSNLLNQGDN